MEQERDLDREIKKKNCNNCTSFIFNPSKSSSPTKLTTTPAGESTILSPFRARDPFIQRKITRIRREPDPVEPSGPEMIRYRECQRNHAAHLGGHVLDGCGEFMPAGEDGTPEALKCAACDCHRNFHRRETDGGTTTVALPLLPPPPPTSANCFISFNTNHKPQKHPTIRPTLTPHHHQPRPPVMVAFGGGGGAAESSSEDLNAYRAGNFPAAAGVPKKRFRTKFTAEQKEKMAEIAERIGWRIQKQNEAEVQRFCGEVGIRRHVFKVWLHNNKQAIKKKQPEITTKPPSSGDDFEEREFGRDDRCCL